MFLIFDTETTGLPRSYNAPHTDTDNWPRLVQLAWQLHDAEGKLVEVKNYIVKPEGFDIPFNAEKIHGISTDRALRTGWDLDKVLTQFEEDIARAEFAVGHNIEFDIAILRCEQHRRNKASKLDALTVADTKTDAIANFTQIPGGKGGKFKWPTLTELYQKLFNETFSEAHNASADVEATARVFLELLRIGIISEPELKREKGFLEPLRTANKEPFKLIGLNIKPYLPNGIELDSVESDSGANKIDLKKNLKALELAPFAHLHNHTQYSVLQSTISIKKLVEASARMKMPAVAFTDIGNMMGAFEFVSAVEKHNKALAAKKEDAQAAGNEFDSTPLLPIVGCELFVCRNRLDKSTKDDGYRIPFLAKNKRGYHNLSKLCSAGHVEGFYYVPRIDKLLLATLKNDLIVTTGGLEGEIPQLILNVGEAQAEQALLWWKEQFEDNFYIELNRHGLEEQEHLNKILIAFSKKHNIKIIATNNTYYIEKEDAFTQDLLMCVKEGEKVSVPIGRGRGFRFGLKSKEHYFKSSDDMKALFADVPEAIINIAEILTKIEPYTLFRDVLLPNFDIPKEFLNLEDEHDGGKRGENAYLRHLAYNGAKKRYGEITPDLAERIDFELETIARTGYPGYFLIVQDFCQAARDMGVSVGPGRGSAAGSVIAYCTGITNVDPIAYDLLFERFLNPERVSLPDIDIDFDDEGRQSVIDYVINKYGTNQVAQIITYGTMASRSSIKDAGRVLDLPLNETNDLAKLIPDKTNYTLKDLLELPIATIKENQRPEDMTLVESLKKIKDSPGLQGEVIRRAAQLEGAVRNTGIHACGVIITPSDIREHIPVATAKDSNMWCTQFDNSVVESAGLLKMDFLGLKTLTLIKDAIAIIKDRHGILIDPDTIPIEDEKTYELFQRGETIGIFQYESPGMQKYLKDLKPTVFADLIAMNALYRPGPLEYIPNFIARKHGREPIVYDLPEMEDNLRETYGITVYQEQVMLLSQRLANFTKGMADKLRKGMGKKDKKVIEEMFPKFLEGGKANGHPEDVLGKIWKDWEAFASYAFNKSHSTCYAWIAYQTAYLKANYPAEYMASVLSNNMNDIKQVKFFMDECKRMRIPVLSPDVNESSLKFAVNAQNGIRFGMGAIKGVGENAVINILENRQKDGEYKSLFDFTKRVDLRATNKKTIENLALSGAFDAFTEGNRAVFFHEENGSIFLEKAIKYGLGHQNEQDSAQVSMFDSVEEMEMPEPPLPNIEDWNKMEKLTKEKEVVGLFLSAHPLDEYSMIIENFCNTPLNQLEYPEQFENRIFRVGGMVTRFEERMTKMGTPFGLMEMEDYEGGHKFAFFREQYLKFKHYMTPGLFLFIEGKVTRKSWGNGESRLEMVIDVIELLENIRDKKLKGIELHVPLSKLDKLLMDEVEAILSAHEGEHKVVFRVHDSEEKMSVNLPMRNGGVAINNLLIDQLNSLNEHGVSATLLK